MKKSRTPSDVWDSKEMIETQPINCLVVITDG